MTNWWDQKCGDLTAFEFLTQTHRHLTDAEVANELARRCDRSSITKKAVKLKRNHNGLSKQGWRRPDGTLAERMKAALEGEGVGRAQSTGDAERPSDVPEGSTVTRTTIDARDNEMVATITSQAITTREQLERSHDIDLDEWVHISPEKHRTWTTPMKLRRYDEDGNRFDIPGTVQNHYLEAVYVRRNPRPLFPIPRPIQMEATFPPIPEPQTGALWRDLIICDAQFGFRRNVYTGEMEAFHDRRVLDLALQLAADLRVDGITWLGDQQDAAEFSTHYDGEPAFHKTTMPAMVEHHWWLKQQRTLLPTARIRMHEGNHDERLRRALNKYIPAALDLRRVDQLDRPPALSWANLLALDALNVEWQGDYPDDREWRNSDLVYLHSDIARNTPGATARKMLKRIKAHVVFAHIHHKEIITGVEETQGRRHVIEAMCPGCACRIDGAVPGSDGWNNFTQGLAVADYEIGGDWAHVETADIIEGEMIYGGKLYTARDRDEEIDTILRNKMEEMACD